MYFIAGVGIASLFDGDKLVATANTLIDSGITIRTTLEDIRRGQGNKLLGRYGHDSQFSLKLTDAMFNLEYIAMNTGSEVELGGDCVINEQLKSSDSGEITLTHTAVPFFGSAVKAYAKLAGTSVSYQAYDVAGGKIVGLENSKEYCVRYMYNNDYATRIVVNSDFIPKTLSVILEANLYSGGSCDDTDNATIAGKIIIKVYRYMLNGSQEIAMTATGAAQTSLEGMALSYGCNGCDNNGAYAEIIQILANAGDDMFDSIVIEDAERTAKAGDKLPLVVYACPKEGAPIRLKNDQFTVPTGSGFTYADGYITIASGATDPVTVTVTAFDKTADLNITING